MNVAPLDLDILTPVLSAILDHVSQIHDNPLSDTNNPAAHYGASLIQKQDSSQTVLPPLPPVCPNDIFYVLGINVQNLPYYPIYSHYLSPLAVGKAKNKSQLSK